MYTQWNLAIIEDIDDDGYEDVIVGTVWGVRSIFALSGKTGETLWIHDTHEYGGGGWVYQVDCRYDYNNDGQADVLAATGDDSTDTGPKRIYCLDAETGDSLWEWFAGGPAFSVIGIEDFTGDGQEDVVAGASNEVETIGYVYGINGDTGLLEWTFTVPGSSVWALEQLDDITGDGIADIAVGDFNGFLFSLDPTDGSEIWSNSLGMLMITRFDVLEDVNGDGYLDILPAHSGLFARVIDGLTGTFIWTTNLPDKSWCVEGIEDISGDGINDVVIGTLFSNNYVVVLDGIDGSELFSVNFGTPVDALTVIPDIVGDGSWEIIAGGRNGKVVCYSGGFEATLGVLEIGSIQGGLVKVTAEVLNVGETAIEDISWNITITGRLLLSGGEVSGDVDILLEGESVDIIDRPLFGLGRITISVQAWSPYANNDQKTAEGFVFLFLVFVR